MSTESDPIQSMDPMEPMAQVAVRAIDNFSSNTQAYFDVRGPGLLVDAYDLRQAGRQKDEPINTYKQTATKGARGRQFSAL